MGFRWFVQRVAHDLELAGYVTNRPDGSVEVVASGSESRLAQLDEAVRRGPRLAKVNRVEKSDYPHEEGIGNSFTIN